MEKINVGNLQPRGAIGQKVLAKGKASIERDLDFALPVEYLFDFTLAQQGMVFDTPVSMFFDNSVNPKKVEVYVDGSGQYFPIAPFSTGWYSLTASTTSKISLISDGGVAGGEKCYVSFVNYEVPAIVWNGFAPLVDGARVTLIGANELTNMGATNPIIVGGNNAGNPVSLKVDATGRLEVIGAAAGGVAYGPDGPGVASSQAPIAIGGVDPGGLTRRILTTITGLLRVSVDSSALPTGAATEATLGTLNTSNANILTRANLLATEVTQASILTRANLLATEATQASILTRANLLALETTQVLIRTAVEAIKLNSDRSVTPTVTTQVLAGASVTILAALAGRKKIMIYNDATVTNYIRFGAAAASATDYSVPLVAGAFYELDNYSGEVRAFGASGTLRITSIV